MKRTLCILLSLMLAVTGFAGLAVPAAAAGTGKAIELVTNGAGTTSPARRQAPCISAITNRAATAAMAITPIP